MTYQESIEKVLDAAGNLVRVKLPPHLWRAITSTPKYRQALAELETAVKHAELVA